MDIDTRWRQAAEQSLHMENKLTLGHPVSVRVFAVHTEQGAITSIIDKGDVRLDGGVLDPSSVASLNLTRVSGGQRATVVTAAMCACSWSHEQVMSECTPDIETTSIDLSKAVTIPRVLPSFAPLVSIHVFIDVRPKVRTRKANVRQRLRASRRMLSGLKRE